MRHAAPHRNEPNLTEEHLGDDVSRASYKARRLSALFDGHSRWRRVQTLSTVLMDAEIAGTQPMPGGLTEEDCAVFHYRKAIGMH